MGWHDTNYDPRVDGYGMEDARPSASDFAEEDWDRERRQKYPRGYGPPYSSENGPEYDDPNGYSLDQNDPAEKISDPGFSEHEVDDWPDPDHGREDKVGGILTQAQQWPHRVAAIQRESWGQDYPAKKKKKEPKPITPVGGDVHRVKGLYGEDEDDPYDVYATPSEHGNGWDVIKPVGE